jgi:hypothetical protein
VAAAGLLAAGTLAGEMWLRMRVRTAIERSLAGTGAKVHFGRISVDFPHRTLTIHNPRLRAQNNDTAHRGFTVVSLDVAVRTVTATLNLRQLSIDKLVVESPRVALVTKKIEVPNSDQTSHESESPESISPHKARNGGGAWSVGEVSVRGGAVEFTRWVSDGESERLAVGGLDVEIGRVGANRTANQTAPSPPREVMGRVASCRMDSIVYLFGRETVEMRADGAAASSADRTVTINRLALTPQLPKNQFSELSPGHGDWTSVTLDSISLRGLDLRALENLAVRGKPAGRETPVGREKGAGRENPATHSTANGSDAPKALIADTLFIARAALASYKNRQGHFVARRIPMIQQSLQQIPVPFDIGVSAIKNIDIVYEELAPGAASPGSVTLSDGSAGAANLTNIAAGHDRFVTIDLAATLMNSGDLAARLQLPVSPDDDHWEVSGSLGPTDMTAFNTALDPLMNIRVAGDIHSVEFRVAGSSVSAHSNVTMRYNNLAVDILDPRNHNRRRELLSFLAEDFLVRPDNPELPAQSDAQVRTSEADYKRDPERSTWNYVWRSVLAAILKTII